MTWEMFLLQSQTLALVICSRPGGGSRLQTKKLCSGLGGFWIVQLIAYSALRSGATKA